MSQLDATGPYILVAPNGARRRLTDHPAIPISMDQIVSTAKACYDAGARGLHLHVRDDYGRHSLDAGRYLETISELQQNVPAMDVQITTEAGGMYDVEAQYLCLSEVKPKWASISVREVAKNPELAARIYSLCEDQGTRVQHILYDAADTDLLIEWQTECVVKPSQVDRLLVLGRYSLDRNSVPEDIEKFPIDTSPWMVCAFGSQEHTCLVNAALRGADVRVGFENSLTMETGQQWVDNAASVAALVAQIKGRSR
ncbi:3-keto-5-aminohexanoate cleavage protein [Ruegeria arenilitoris]|uniref:3-keto-5-aminohexanoate cleavage protein n=1 Tax=Ruegeria arenilitoris TaxID=1173585 RepID=UPI003463AF4B